MVDKIYQEIKVFAPNVWDIDFQTASEEICEAWDSLEELLF
jgi:hypothetical protein